MPMVATGLFYVAVPISKNTLEKQILAIFPGSRDGT